jgi:uncharacterized membrane protein (UPF0127 family)
MNNWQALALSAGLLSTFAHGAALSELEVGQARLQVEIAKDSKTRQLGLMFRKELPANRGMLFTFERPEIQCLWMKDTYIPLTAAFLDEAGKIVDLIDLEPHSLQTRCAKAPASYAIEVNQGWFRDNGIGEGDVVRGL